MTPLRKWLIGSAIIGGFTWGLAVLALSLAGADPTEPPTETALIVTGVPILIAHAAAWIYGLAWIRTNVAGRQARTNWFFGVLIGGSFGALVWWLRFIVPAPTAEP